MAGEQTNDEVKHLQYFKIENFKGFESFELEDIGQFNIIVGDNNVGKTSVLEALCFDEDAKQYLMNLQQLLVFKNLWVLPSRYINLRLLMQLWSNNKKIRIQYKTGSNNKVSSFTFFLKENTALTENERALVGNAQGLDVVAILESGQTTNLSLPFNFPYEDDNTFLSTYKNIPCIPTNRSLQNDTLVFYSGYVQGSKAIKSNFIHDLKVFLPEIEDIDISNAFIPSRSTIIVRSRNTDLALPLNVFGDGAVKLFQILVEIAVQKNNRLMIDEIDDGIHYSRFKNFWRTIIKAARRNNVQIFATTHNIECLRYLKEVLEEEDMKENQSLFRSYTLVKSPQGNVKAFKHTFEDIDYALEHDLEIRGLG